MLLVKLTDSFLEIFSNSFSPAPGKDLTMVMFLKELFRPIGSKAVSLRLKY